MTIKEVENILNTCTFTREDDRRYWEEKLAELIRKEQAAKENDKYFRKMTKYDR